MAKESCHTDKPTRKLASACELLSPIEHGTKECDMLPGIL